MKFFRTFMFPRAARNRLSAGLLACGLLVAGSASALVSPTMRDTFVDQARPTELRGAWGSVNVSPTARGLLAFELAALLPAGTKAEDVRKAVLQVRQHWVLTPGSVEFVRLLEAFSETATTANSAPRSMGPGSGVTAQLTDHQTPLLVDVTTLVKAALVAGQTQLMLEVRTALQTPAASVELGSKEGGYPAILDISLAAGDAAGRVGPQGPAGAQGPAGVQGPAGAQGVAGRAGATGAQGERGLQGAQGVQGAPGAQGPAGKPVPLTYFWVTAGKTTSCRAACSWSGAIAAATPEGMVCKDGSGGQAREQQRVDYSSRDFGNGEYCGSAFLAQCSCLLKP